MNSAQINSGLLARAAATAATLVCVAGLPACRGERSDEPPRQFIPDMDDSPKFKNQVQTGFFEDGRVMRPRVAGAVAFGESMNADDVSRPSYLKEDAVLFQGFDPAIEKNKDGDPAYVNRMPAAALDAWIAERATHGRPAPADRAAAMEEMIKRGQQRFNIYCSACHGYEADGRGMVGVRWGALPPNFHDPKYKDANVKTGKDGYFFYTIQNGVPDVDPAKPPKMPSYADKVKPLDAWAIIAYIRAQQAARHDQPKADAAPPANSGPGEARTEVTK